MANIEINQLPTGLGLTGSEEIPMDQGANTVKSTTQDVANLATLQSITAGTSKDLIDGVNLQGTDAGNGNTGTDVNAFGSNAAINNSGSSVNGIGTGAAFANTGAYVNAIGDGVASNNDGDFVNAIGQSAAESNIANNINVMGSDAAASNSGNDLNAFGYQAGKLNSGANVNAFGSQAGLNNTFSNVQLLGKQTNATANDQLVTKNTDGNSMRIGYGALTADRLYTMPDKSGTVAMTSDITTPTYKSYVAQISQFGTNPPTTNNVFQNEMTNAVTFSYVGVGQYRINCTDFDTSKVFALISPGSGSSGDWFSANPTTGVVNITSADASGTLGNGRLNYTNIEIRVYP